MTKIDKARLLAGEVTDPETRAALDALCQAVAELEQRQAEKKTRLAEITETIAFPRHNTSPEILNAVMG
jgi:hypothetical protein